MPDPAGPLPGRCTAPARGVHGACTMHGRCTGRARGVHRACTGRARACKGVHGPCTGRARARPPPSRFVTSHPSAQKKKLPRPLSYPPKGAFIVSTHICLSHCTGHMFNVPMTHTSAQGTQPSAEHLCTDFQRIQKLTFDDISRRGA